MGLRTTCHETKVTGYLRGSVPHPAKDCRPLNLCIFDAKRRKMKVFVHFLKKVAGFGVEPRKKDIQLDDYF
jgi:hypothetical protein